MEWTAMLLLGAYHGINPGMGWLFAVALRLQQRRASGVYRALLPLALGHAVAVGVVILVALGVGTVVGPRTLAMTVGSLLIALGGYRLWRHRHPVFGGMQVGVRDLTIWSCLMASAHGAGVIVLPFILPMSADVLAAVPGHGGHGAPVSAAHGLADALLALGVHTAAYLAVTGTVAAVVYHKLGLALLRTAWFNVDWFWAAGLVVAGIVVLAG